MGRKFDISISKTIQTNSVAFSGLRCLITPMQGYLQYPLFRLSTIQFYTVFPLRLDLVGIMLFGGRIYHQPQM